MSAEDTRQDFQVQKLRLVVMTPTNDYEVVRELGKARQGSAGLGKARQGSAGLGSTGFMAENRPVNAVNRRRLSVDRDEYDVLVLA